MHWWIYNPPKGFQFLIGRLDTFLIAVYMTKVLRFQFLIGRLDTRIF